MVTGTPYAAETPAAEPGARYGLDAFPDLPAEVITAAEDYVSTVVGPPMGPEERGYHEALSVRRKWNQVGAQYAPVLETRLGAPDPDIRYYIAILLGGTHCDPAIEALKQALENESDPRVKHALMAALAESGFRTAELVGQLVDIYVEDWEQRKYGFSWDLALLIASIHRPEAAELQPEKDVYPRTDGGLGPLFDGAIKFRDLNLGK